MKFSRNTLKSTYKKYLLSKTMKPNAFIMVALIFLAGCAGGTFANLIPLPKVLKGDIVNSVYHSPQGNFLMLTPFPEGSDDFTYMEVKENSRDNWENVTFISSTKPHSIYRVEVGVAEPVDEVRTANEYANESIAYFEKRYEKAGMENFKLVESGKEMLSGITYEYRVTNYRVTSQFAPSTLTVTKPFRSWALLLVHANPNGVVFLSFDFDGDCKPCMNGDIRAVIDRKTDIKRIVKSIKVPDIFIRKP